MIPHAPPPADLTLRPYFWGFALLFAIMFLIFPVGFKGPDYPIYPAYLDSIVVDGDLNVINNVTETAPDQTCAEAFRAQRVTKSYNFADFHNTGSTILWMPFYLYGQGLAVLNNMYFSGSEVPEQADHILLCSLSFCNMTLGFLACLITFITAANFFSPRTAFWSTILIFWGTPAFFYTLIENGNANIPAMFMSVVLLIATPTGLSGKHWQPAFLTGLLFALCVAIKIDLWFQIFMMIATIIFLHFNGTLRPLNLLYLLLGYLIGEVPRVMNDYIKFGGFHSGEAGIINLRNSYHLQQLISPYQGFFSSSPILFLCLLGLPLMIWVLLRKSTRQSLLYAPDHAIQRIILAMTIWLGAKLFIIGFRFAWGGGTFGARQLLTELPYFVLLLNYIMHLNHTQNNIWLRLLLPALLIPTILINLFHAGEYLLSEPMSYYLRPQLLLDRLEHLRYLGIVFAKGFEQIPLKLTTAPFIILTLWLTWTLLNRSREINTLLAPWEVNARRIEAESKRNCFQHGIKTLTIYMLFTWFAISTTNAMHNKSNVDAMTEEGCFDFVTVVPPNWFELDENIASMKEMIYYYRLKGDLKEVEHIQSICKLLYPTEFYRLYN
jgi:hypothetical protein